MPCSLLGKAWTVCYNSIFEFGMASIISLCVADMNRLNFFSINLNALGNCKVGFYKQILLYAH